MKHILTEILAWVWFPILLGLFIYGMFVKPVVILAVVIGIFCLFLLYGVGFIGYNLYFIIIDKLRDIALERRLK